MNEDDEPASAAAFLEGDPGPPAGGGGDPSDPLVFARVEIEIPKGLWLSVFSRRHPDLHVQIRNTMAVDEHRALHEIEVFGSPADWTREIGAIASVVRAERVVDGTERSRYRVLSARPHIQDFARAAAVLLSYPRTIRNGIYAADTIARRSEIRRLMAALRAERSGVKIVSLRGGPTAAESLTGGELKLTPVQRELFRHAFELGYFEVPRRITLSQLAEKVGRSKSSVSHALALVERALASAASRATV